MSDSDIEECESDCEVEVVKKKSKAKPKVPKAKAEPKPRAAPKRKTAAEKKAQDEVALRKAEEDAKRLDENKAQMVAECTKGNVASLKLATGLLQEPDCWKMVIYSRVARTLERYAKSCEPRKLTRGYEGRLEYREARPQHGHFMAQDDKGTCLCEEGHKSSAQELVLVEQLKRELAVMAKDISRRQADLFDKKARGEALTEGEKALLAWSQSLVNVE